MWPPDPALVALLSPPCIGAFIGYLTNKVAIRMLFRPLHPWRIFGLRVPMTPGVIPSKRAALAENIGAMVGRHLLTGRDIGGAISAEPFQVHLQQLVDRHVDELLKRELGPLPEIIPKRFAAYFQIGIKTLKYRFAERVNIYLAGDEFADKLADLAGKRLDELVKRDLRTILPEGTGALSAELTQTLLNTLLDELLTEGRGDAWLAGCGLVALQAAADSGRTIGELLPEEFCGQVRSLLLEQGPQLLTKLAEQLEEPKFRAELSHGILAGTDHFLKTLGPVGAMARGFFEVDTLERTIDAYLQQKREDLIAWTRTPEQQARLAGIIGTQVDQLLQTEMTQVLEQLGTERTKILCRTLARQALTALHDEATRAALRGSLGQSLEQTLRSLLVGERVEEADIGKGIAAESAAGEMDNGPCTVRNLGQRFLPSGTGATLRHKILIELTGLFRGPATERLVHTMVGDLIEGFLRQPLGRIYDIVPHGVRQGSSEYLVLSINRMLLQEVPGIVRSLNLERVVRDKVNGLDLMQLERLLLSIMEEQFKYINLFGALLGFLIGWLNVLISRLT